MDTTARKSECNAEEVLFVAIELGWGRWKVGTTVALAQKPRLKSVSGGDVEGFLEELERAKRRFGLAPTASVVCCYEAGRDGFWIHRCLESQGIETVVVDPASISVNRRKRRRKTDRLDAAKLLIHLMHWFAGQEKAWSVVQVPSVEDEDARQFHRELECLKKERTRSSNRIKGLLAAQGVRIKTVGKGFLEELRAAKLWDGSEVPCQLRDRLEREFERMQLTAQQIKELERQRAEALRRVKDVRLDKIRRLQNLRSIGDESAWLLVMEFFGWRDFKNVRQVGSLAGLTPTPYDSGGSEWEQGIDKAGNRRVRTMAIELAWCWVRYQPQSQLTQWFQNRWGGGTKRMRRVGIVALARKLLIALWKYLEEGVVPEGAVLKAQ